MALIASESSGSSGGNYQPIEPGMYQAICYGIIDLGTHFDETWKKSRHKVCIQWEIPEIRIELERDGQTIDAPRITSKQYPLSLHEKSGLRKDLESWRGRAFTAEELRGFDLAKLLGVNCLLNIVHQTKDNGKTYANIAGIVPLMKGQPVLKPETPLCYFALADGDPIPPEVPKWCVEQIMSSDEWAISQAKAKVASAAPSPTGQEVPPPGQEQGALGQMENVPF